MNALSKILGTVFGRFSHQDAGSTETLEPAPCSLALRKIMDEAARQGHTIEQDQNGGVVISRVNGAHKIANSYDPSGNLISKGGRGLSMC